MRKRFAYTILTLGVGIILVNQAKAGVVDDRRHNQKLRIRHGVITGELTRGEARVLKKEQRRIHRKLKKAWADGQMSRREWRRIERMQNRASRHIYRLKHNSNFRHRASFHRYQQKHDHRPRYRAPYYSYRLNHSTKSKPHRTKIYR